MSRDPFLVHRSLLFTVAYEMLGSAADASVLECVRALGSRMPRDCAFRVVALTLA